MWPRKIFSGTMSGSVMRSLYTRAWNTWIEPSSDEDAKSGYVGWKCTERSARAWYLLCHGEGASAPQFG